MKVTNWVKLLSVLLCSVLLLVACKSDPLDGGDDSADSSDTTVATDTEVGQDSETAAGGERAPGGENTPGGEVEDDQILGPVEPIFSNFFTMTPTPTKMYRTLKTVTPLVGEEVEYEDLEILRTATVDSANNVNEIYTVYNGSLKKTVLTLTNTYRYDQTYDTFDFDDIENCVFNPLANYPNAAIDFLIDDYSGWKYLQVTRAVITPIDEKLIEEYNGAYYTVDLTYEFYDLAGNKITETKWEPEIWEYNVTDFGRTLFFGNVHVSVDRDGYVTEVREADKTVTVAPYDAETDRYGYYWDDLYQYGALREKLYFLEVYQKDGHSLLLRHYFDRTAGSHAAYALQNGDVLIQYGYEVDDDSDDYDVIFYGEKFRYKTVLLDVSSGEEKELSFNYVLISVMSGKDFEEEGNLSRCGISVTDNTRNVALALPIEHRNVDVSTGRLNVNVLVLNNDASVMFAYESMIPEQSQFTSRQLNIFGMMMLPNGDYLVEVDSITASSADFAIVRADGTVRCYVPSNAMVVDEYLVLSGDGIYDYDLNLLYEFQDYDFYDTFGSHILVTKMMPDASGSGTHREYFKMVRKDGVFAAEALFGDDNADMAIENLEDDYMIIYNNETEKYSLYNVEMECLLTTYHSMSVERYEDAYLFSASDWVAGGDVMFSGYNVWVIEE